MIRKWHHGHSLGTGALVGFLAAGYRPWLILFAGVTLGVAGTLSYRFGKKVAHAVGRSLASYTTTRLKAEVRERQKQRREARLPQSAELPF